jgi:hypothetical protein
VQYQIISPSGSALDRTALLFSAQIVQQPYQANQIGPDYFGPQPSRLSTAVGQKGQGRPHASATMSAIS